MEDDWQGLYLLLSYAFHFLRSMSREVSARIAFAMTMRGLTSKELAERIGIDPCTLSRKQKDPSKYTLAEISRIERVTKTKILEVSK